VVEESVFIIAVILGLVAGYSHRIYLAFRRKDKK
jgi:hypothetical protein